MSKPKLIVVIILFLAALGYVSFSPAQKYESSISMSSLFQLPEEFQGWRGTDVSDGLNINWDESRFGFISDALAYNYSNARGDNLLFIVLDAGNFHHPKNCFTSSGYTIRELPDTVFNAPGHSFKAHTLFTKRADRSFLNFYWIVINKKVAHDWVEQKLKQLYFSVLNKKRVGLMVRLDIPAGEDDIDNAKVLASQFVEDLSRSLQKESEGYIFGIQ